MSLKPKKIGIIGGGQLAQMLIEASRDLNYEVHILSENDNDPAAQYTNLWHKGSYRDPKTLKNFLKKIDTLTFESEFIKTDVLKNQTSGSGVKVFPSLKHMSLWQDRSTQKSHLIKNKIKTAAFIDIDLTSKKSTNESEKKTAKINSLSHFFDSMPKGIVIKTKTNGYDGYGTTLIRTKKELKHFIKTKPLTDFIAEELIPFKRELAISAFRNNKAEISFLPLVESHQKDNKCLWVKGPIQLDAIKGLRLKIRKLLDKMNYVGAISFELFEFDGQLIVNEIAPRVHNSAHYSQDSFIHSQFHLHLLAITNAPLKITNTHPQGFAMYNLVGSSNRSPSLSLCTKSRMHWYHKTINRPGRKMGHLNSTAKTPEEALKNVKHDAKRMKL